MTTQTPRGDKIDPEAAPPPHGATPTAHPLVGAGLHQKNEAGAVQRQAVILAVVPSGNPSVGDLALIQHFEWLTGSASTRRLIPLTSLADERWVLYADTEDMNDHYERVDKHHPSLSPQPIDQP